METCLKSMPTAVHQSTLSIPPSLDSATNKFTEMNIFQHSFYVSLKTSFSWYQYKPVWRNRWKPSKLVPSNHKTCKIFLFAKQNWSTKSEELEILQISSGLMSLKELWWSTYPMTIMLDLDFVRTFRSITESESATWKHACQGFSQEFVRQRICTYLCLCRCSEPLQNKHVIFAEWACGSFETL